MSVMIQLVERRSTNPKTLVRMKFRSRHVDREDESEINSHLHASFAPLKNFLDQPPSVSSLCQAQNHKY